MYIRCSFQMVNIPGFSMQKCFAAANPLKPTPQPSNNIGILFAFLGISSSSISKISNPGVAKSVEETKMICPMSSTLTLDLIKACL